jgi:hypothetical protein
MGGLGNGGESQARLARVKVVVHVKKEGEREGDID